MNVPEATNLDRKSGIRGPKTIFFDCFLLAQPQWTL
jgi:hypothetical protein